MTKILNLPSGTIRSNWLNARSLNGWSYEEKKLLYIEHNYTVGARLGKGPKVRIPAMMGRVCWLTPAPEGGLRATFPRPLPDDADVFVEKQPHRKAAMRRYSAGTDE